MTKTTKITIGLLNSNGFERLKKVLPSILNQKYENKEILVVDNGSTDGSINFLKGFENIKVIENGKNLGYGAGKNLLVKESAGEYIFMLDNDIELSDNELLGRIFDKFKILENCFFLTPLLKDVDNNIKTQRFGYFYSYLNRGLDIKKLQNINYFKAGSYLGGAVFFKKNKFIELGMYDEIYPFNIDDIDMSCRVYHTGGICYIDSQNMCIHHGIESNKTKKIITFKYKYVLAGLLRIIVKNYSIKNIIIWLPISFLWITIKSIKFSIKNKTFGPFIENIKSFFRFIRDLPDTLKQRKIIQSKRIIKEDIFLTIKPPKINKNDK